MCNYRVCILFFMLMLVSACSTVNPAETSAYEVVSPGTLRPGDPIPAPSGDVILTLTGSIANTNAEDQLDLDMATLEQMELVEYTVDDPYLNDTLTFRGVLLDTLLNIAHADENATELFTTALDDYQTAIPLSVIQWPVLVATTQDGERMPVSDKGPIRIIFPYHHYDLAHEDYRDYWVWQLRTIEVR